MRGAKNSTTKTKPAGRTTNPPSNPGGDFSYESAFSRALLERIRDAGRNEGGPRTVVCIRPRIHSIVRSYYWAVGLINLRVGKRALVRVALFGFGINVFPPPMLGLRWMAAQQNQSVDKLPHTARCANVKTDGNRGKRNG